MAKKKRDEAPLPLDMFRADSRERRNTPSRGSGSAPPSSAHGAPRREDGGRIPDELEYLEDRLEVDRARYQIMTANYHDAVDYVLRRNPDLADEACLSVSGLTAASVLERTGWAEDSAIIDDRIWNRRTLDPLVPERERLLREEQRALTALQYDLFLEYVNQREPELADRALGRFLDESAADLVDHISPEARERNRFPGEAEARLDELRIEGGDVESLLKCDRETASPSEQRNLVEASRREYTAETRLYAQMVREAYERSPRIADAACLEISGLTAYESLERDSWSFETEGNRDWPTPAVSNRTEIELRMLQADTTLAKRECFIDIVSHYDQNLAYDVGKRNRGMTPAFAEPEARAHYRSILTYPGSGDRLIDACRVTCGNVEERFRQDSDRERGLSRELESRGRFAEGAELER